MLKLNEFMYFKERTLDDFVKVPLSEKSLFERQVQAYSESDFEKNLPAIEAQAEGNDFLLEEKHFKQLREEIAKRREVKE